jgi:hypothetical protein
MESSVSGVTSVRQLWNSPFGAHSAAGKSARSTLSRKRLATSGECVGDDAWRSCSRASAVRTAATAAMSVARSWSVVDTFAHCTAVRPSSVSDFIFLRLR